MNFDDAINAHVKWKQKLQIYLNKPDKTLDPVVVGADNKCDLGIWLHGEGKKNVSNPKFQELIIEHAKFHKAAADIIKKADSGQNITEEIALGAKSDFANQSQKVVTIIMHCKKECKM